MNKCNKKLLKQLEQPTNNLVIHAGPHKTGTSYIQKKCVDNYELLKGSRVLYPKTGIRAYGHHEIPRAVSNGAWRNSRLYSSFLEEIRDGEAIFLSSENFSMLDSKGWDEFGSDFNPLILYLSLIHI